MNLDLPNTLAVGREPETRVDLTIVTQTHFPGSKQNNPMINLALKSDQVV